MGGWLGSLAVPSSVELDLVFNYSKYRYYMKAGPEVIKKFMLNSA